MGLTLDDWLSLTDDSKIRLALACDAVWAERSGADLDPTPEQVLLEEYL